MLGISALAALASAGGLAAQDAAAQATLEKNVSAANENAAAAAPDTAAVAAILDTMRDVFEQDLADGKFEESVSLVHPHFMQSPPGHPPIRGRDAAVAYQNRHLPPELTARFEPIKMQVIDDEWAYELGTFRAAYVPQGADEERSVTQTYLIVYRNEGDGWKVYRKVYNSDSPPQGGP